MQSSASCKLRGPVVRNHYNGDATHPAIVSVRRYSVERTARLNLFRKASNSISGPRQNASRDSAVSRANAEQEPANRVSVQSLRRPSVGRGPNALSPTPAGSCPLQCRPPVRAAPPLAAVLADHHGDGGSSST
jgi:hypothetical protein